MPKVGKKSSQYQQHGGKGVAAPSPAKPSVSLTRCRDILKELMSKKHRHYAWPFYAPMDASYAGLRHYYEIVRHPMDMTTMLGKLDRHEYATCNEFAADMHLVCQNAYDYAQNPRHESYLMAMQLERAFEALYSGKAAEPLPPETLSLLASLKKRGAQLSKTYARQSRLQTRLVQATKDMTQHNLAMFMFHKGLEGVPKSEPAAPAKGDGPTSDIHGFKQNRLGDIHQIKQNRLGELKETLDECVSRGVRSTPSVKVNIGEVTNRPTFELSITSTDQEGEEDATSNISATKEEIISNTHSDERKNKAPKEVLETVTTFDVKEVATGEKKVISTHEVLKAAAYVVTNIVANIVTNTATNVVSKTATHVTPNTVTNLVTNIATNEVSNTTTNVVTNTATNIDQNTARSVVSNTATNVVTNIASNVVTNIAINIDQNTATNVVPNSSTNIDQNTATNVVINPTTNVDQNTATTVVRETSTATNEVDETVPEANRVTTDGVDKPPTNIITQLEAFEEMASKFQQNAQVSAHYIMSKLSNLPPLPESDWLAKDIKDLREFLQNNDISVNEHKSSFARRSASARQAMQRLNVKWSQGFAATIRELRNELLAPIQRAHSKETREPFHSESQTLYGIAMISELSDHNWGEYFE